MSDLDTKAIRERAEQPKCAICGEPAVCFGSYESNYSHGFACDTCCGHGNEDGHCTRDFSTIGEMMNDALKCAEEAEDSLIVATRERDAARAESRDLVWVLEHEGFRRCDIAACNCRSWHSGPNLRAEKAEEERDEAREEATEMRHQAVANLDVAEKARDVAKDIAKQRDAVAAELDAARAELAQVMGAMDNGADDSRWRPGESAVQALIRERDELRAELAQAQAKAAGMEALFNQRCREGTAERAELAQAKQEREMLRDVLDDALAAFSDRVLARGPLSKSYANAIIRKMTAALDGTGETA